MDAHLLNRKYSESLPGQFFETNNSGRIKVIKYNSYDDILIEFLRTGTRKKVSISQIRKGLIRDDTVTSKYSHLSFGVGTIGCGKYFPMRNKAAYRYWRDMLRRCYDPSCLFTNPTYDKCSVCNEWLDFQIFAEWYYHQYKEEKWQLDKDIIKKGNKIYCPQYCAFVPSKINNLFREKRKDKTLPTGVFKKGNKYIAIIRTAEGVYECLGRYTTINAAYNHYKQAKEMKMKIVASEYKNRIDPRIYRAMMEYEVEITD